MKNFQFAEASFTGNGSVPCGDDPERRSDGAKGAATGSEGKVHPNSGGKGAPAALVVSAHCETRGTELRASYPAVNENPREPASIHGLRVALAAVIASVVFGVLAAIGEAWR